MAKNNYINRQINKPVTEGKNIPMSTRKEDVMSETMSPLFLSPVSLVPIRFPCDV